MPQVGGEWALRREGEGEGDIVEMMKSGKYTIHNLQFAKGHWNNTSRKEGDGEKQKILNKRLAFTWHLEAASIVAGKEKKKEKRRQKKSIWENEKSEIRNQESSEAVLRAAIIRRRGLQVTSQTVKGERWKVKSRRKKRVRCYCYCYYHYHYYYYCSLPLACCVLRSPAKERTLIGQTSAFPSELLCWHCWIPNWKNC